MSPPATRPPPAARKRANATVHAFRQALLWHEANDGPRTGARSFLAIVDEICRRFEMLENALAKDVFDRRAMALMVRHPRLRAVLEGKTRPERLFDGSRRILLQLREALTRRYLVMAQVAGKGVPYDYFQDLLLLLYHRQGMTDRQIGTLLKSKERAIAVRRRRLVGSGKAADKLDRLRNLEESEVRQFYKARSEPTGKRRSRRET